MEQKVLAKRKQRKKMGQFKQLYVRLAHLTPAQLIPQLATITDSQSVKSAEPKKEEEIMSGETMVEYQQQFNSSRRAGRRNAMADLGLEGADPGAYKLAEQFEQLGHDKSQTPGPSTSKRED